ncbi:chlorite dismutase family protein [Methylobacterium sp.]|uniref:chlorite dismutase family protein n=1 Tax=Methylobacterium sp. TaxID=409 RepID=UPI003456D182
MFTFTGGSGGAWRVVESRTVKGEGLRAVESLAVAREPDDTAITSPAWTLRGFISNVRYATKTEVETLRSVQQGLARPRATLAALIPIRKNAAWWALAQDERREIFEETSHHTAIGLDYLPAVARRLHHSRDLGEPFDFLTWFEYAPEDAPAFDRLVDRLRATREWNYVDREIEIRLARAA